MPFRRFLPNVSDSRSSVKIVLCLNTGVNTHLTEASSTAEPSAALAMVAEPAGWAREALWNKVVISLIANRAEI